MTQTYLRALAIDTLDGIFLADGTMWAHAATLGTRIKGTKFTIDHATVENFVKVFSSGYPRKVPLDYDHGLVMPTDGSGKAIKAGDVMEMRGAYSVEDLRAMEGVEAKVTRAGRKLEDPRNFGLWIRMRPTARAKKLIEDGEYTELSITFFSNYEHNVTGEDQGPTIVAVALTNLPFLDDMIPVAASRGAGGDRAAPGESTTPAGGIMGLRESVAAWFGKVPATDDEAISLTQTNITEMRSKLQQAEPAITFSKMVGEALGETDPGKAVIAVQQLKQESASLKAAAVEGKKSTIKAQVDGVLLKYEPKLTPTSKEYFGKNLTAELEKGTELGKTETEKLLAALGGTGITGQNAAPDAGAGTEGAAGTAATGSLEDRIALRADQLVKSDAECQALEKAHGFVEAYKLAMEKAGTELGYKKPAHPRDRYEGAGASVGA